MKRLFATILLFSTHFASQAQLFQWVRASFSNGFSSEITGLAYANGQVVATGSFGGTLVFANQTITSTGGPTSTARTALTGQWSAQSTLNWLTRSGATPATVRTNAVLGKAVSADAAGNSYVEYVTGTGDSMFGSILVHIPAAVVAVIVLVKYDPAGNILWLKTFTGSNGMEPGGLRVDAAGNCWLAASFSGQAVVGADTLQSSQTGYNTPDGLLIKLDSNGNVLWHNEIPASAGRMFDAIGTDAAGNVYATGHFFATVRFGPAVGLFNSNNGQMFVVKFDAAGTALWARSMGSPEADMATALAVDAAGAVTVCGSFGHKFITPTTPATATFGPFALTTVGTDGYTDGFVVQLNALGVFAWAQAISGIGEEYPDAIALGGQGELYVSGQGNSGTRVGPFITGTGNGSADGFVAKFSAAGSPQWIVGYGGPGDDYFAGAALATDKQGRIYVGGYFIGSAYFDAISVASYPGQGAAFIAQITDNQVLATQPPRTALLALRVYPNPAHGSVQVEWPATAHPRTLELVDLVGRTVFSTSVARNATSQVLSLSGLSTGLYVVKAAGETPNAFAAQRLLVE